MVAVIAFWAENWSAEATVTIGLDIAPSFWNVSELSTLLPNMFSVAPPLMVTFEEAAICWA